MPWMPRLLKLLPPALLPALLTACCKRAPAQPTVVRQPCLTAELLAARPRSSDLMTCSLSNRLADCLAHEVLERDAFIVRVLANCGVKP